MSNQAAYRLKTVQFRGRDCQILLQNENGPCPLLAAANALLLQQKIKLPAAAVRNNVASLADLTNVLANFAMAQSGSAGGGADNAAFYLDELLQQIPKLEHGMDVNPKFTAGVTGYENTQQLVCFDLWQVKLVHGWLLDPAESPDELFQTIGNKTYNELIEVVIRGKDAETQQVQVRTELEQLRTTNDNDDTATLERIAELQDECERLERDATQASSIDFFLNATGHQLTQYGLQALHQHVQADEVVVFFRNNHFCTLTKHEQALFLLVTDLGYATTPMVVWERLDVIDGDTEYVNSAFCTPASIQQDGSSLTPEQLLAQSSQNDADYHLALQLSAQPSQGQLSASSQAALDSQEGQLMAAATEASLREFHQQQQGADTANGVGTTAALPAIGETVAVGVPVAEPAPAAASTSTALTTTTNNDASAASAPPADATMQEAADALLAQQLAKELEQQQQQASQASQPGAHAMHDDDDDWRLARQLQDEEEQEAARQRLQTQRTTTTTTSTQQPSTTSSSSKCVIS